MKRCLWSYVRIWLGLHLRSVAPVPPPLQIRSASPPCRDCFLRSRCRWVKPLQPQVFHDNTRVPRYPGSDSVCTMSHHGVIIGGHDHGEPRYVPHTCSLCDIGCVPRTAWGRPLVSVCRPTLACHLLSQSGSIVLRPRHYIATPQSRLPSSRFSGSTLRWNQFEWSKRQPKPHRRNRKQRYRTAWPVLCTQAADAVTHSHPSIHPGRTTLLTRHYRLCSTERVACTKHVCRVASVCRVCDTVCATSLNDVQAARSASHELIHLLTSLNTKRRTKGPRHHAQEAWPQSARMATPQRLPCLLCNKF